MNINETDEDIRVDFMRGAEMTCMFESMKKGNNFAEIWCDTHDNRGEQTALITGARAAGFTANIHHGKPQRFFFIRSTGYGFAAMVPENTTQDKSSNVYAALGMYSDGGPITEESAVQQWDAMLAAVKKESGMLSVLQAVLGDALGLRNSKRKCGGMGSIEIGSLINGKPVITNVCISCMVDAVNGDDAMLEVIKADNDHLRGILMAFLQAYGVDMKGSVKDVKSVAPSSDAIH